MNDLNDDIAELYAERAGILEYCAGLPRVKAEALARAEAETDRKAREQARLDDLVSQP